MCDGLASLYPREVQQFKIIERISIPGFPPELVPNLKGITDLRQFYGPRLLDELVVSQDGVMDRLAFVDKLKPHGLCDMMVLASDYYCKSSISDLAETTAAVVLNIAHSFLEFVGEIDNVRRFDLDDGHLHICYNYDANTVDRESGMNEKRFHLHLNYWSGEELGQYEPCLFRNLPSVSWQHRLLDPIAFLGEQIAYDVLKTRLTGFCLLPPDRERDLRLGLPAGFKIRFDDWSILQDPNLVQVLRLMHDCLDNTYSQLARAFTGTDDPPQAWQRHPLLPPAEIMRHVQEIEYLSENSRQGLAFLANTLRDISPKVMAFLRKRRWARVRHLTIAGLFYSLGLYSPESNRIGRPILDCRPVYLVMQPKLFADMGGAGVTYMKNVPVIRILRGDGVLTPEQIVRRREFQAAFMVYVHELLRSDSQVRWL
jgi:hypothetical protein